MIDSSTDLFRSSLHSLEDRADSQGTNSYINLNFVILSEEQVLSRPFKKKEKRICHQLQ